MIELTPWLIAELERRARAEAPEECCGLIGSTGDRIGLWAAENVAKHPRTSFAIAPETQFGILKQMDGRGEHLAGVYHSHPRSSPEPSDRDRTIAELLGKGMPGLTWVIAGWPGGDDDRNQEHPGVAPEFWVGVLA